MTETTNPPPDPHPQPEHWYLIRGLIRESGHWGEFPGLLKQGLGASEVHCLDLPGTGAHYQVPSPTSIRKIVGFLRKEYREHLDRRQDLAEERLQSPRRFAVSLSLGSMVALQWASQFPEDFDGLVIINTSLPSLSAFYERIRPQALWSGLKAVIQRTPEERERRILELTSNNPVRREQVWPDWVAIQKNRPVSLENGVRQLTAALTVGLPKPPSGYPVLLLRSAADRLVDPVCTERLQKKFGWPMKTHPEAGHDLPLDDPEWTIRAIRDWRDSLP